MNKIKSISRGSDEIGYQAYDATLPLVLNEVKNIIQEALPAAQVEHVGSSAIPGIGGRNALDIVIAADNAQHEAIKQRLYTIGFQDSPFQHFLPLLVGSISHKDKDYAILLYVMASDADIYKGWIAFRDYMRTHPDDASAYDQVKKQAVADGKVHAGQYQEAKTPFLLALSEKIRASSK